MFSPTKTDGTGNIEINLRSEIRDYGGATRSLLMCGCEICHQELNVPEETRTFTLLLFAAYLQDQLV